MSRLFVGSSSSRISGFAEQRLREQHAQLPAGRDGAHRSSCSSSRCRCRAAARRRALRPCSRPARRTSPRARRRARSRPRSRRGPRRSRPSPACTCHISRVAHQHDVEHAHVLVRELVLLELAQPLVRVERDIAARRLEIAAEDLHQRRLAAAVRADQAVAIAVAELDADVLEQGLRPELHGDVGGGQHVEVTIMGEQARVKPVILLESSTYLKVSRSGFRALRYERCPVAPLRSPLPLDALRRPARAGGGGFACRGARRRRPRPDRPRRGRAACPKRRTPRRAPASRWSAAPSSR